jgi:transcriptional regulator with XRE-family HTH domain
MKVKSGKINEFAFEKRQIAKRIKNISEGLGYKFDHDFAAYLGLKKGTYSTILNGVSALSFRTIMRLVNKKVNLNYLFYGTRARYGGLFLPLSSNKTSEFQENEGVYIEKIGLLEQENESLKIAVLRLEATVKDKETIIEMKNREIKALLRPTSELKA